jgi:hypothetical protein
MTDINGKKTGGRSKGTPNKKTFDAQALAERMGIDPLELLLNFAMGDWKALGYDSSIQTKLVGETAISEDTIPVSIRAQAAKEAAQYLYPKRKAIEHTGKDGTDLFIDRIMNAKRRIEEVDDAKGND